MNTIAHASSREKAKLQIKKMRKHKLRMKAEDAKLQLEMSPEEYDELKKKRYEKSDYELLQTALWDYKLRQFPPMRFKVLRDMIKRRLEEEINQTERRELEAILHELGR